MIISPTARGASPYPLRRSVHCHRHCIARRMAPCSTGLLGCSKALQMSGFHCRVWSGKDKRTVRPAHARESLARDNGLPSEASAGSAEVGMSDSAALRILSDPALEGEPLKMLKLNDAFWKALKEQPARRGPSVVKTRHRRMPKAADFDVCVCGGTLGIFLATTLQMRGYSVCIIEKDRLEGRTQEWNVNDHEIQELVRQGAVSPSELEAAVVTRFNPVRVSFKGGKEMWVRDVLSTGVSPRALLEAIKRRFLEAGGVLCEERSFKSAEVYNDGVSIRLAGEGISSSYSDKSVGRLPHQLSTAKPSTSGRDADLGGGVDEIRARLMVDCMGHWSPIVKQMRGSRKPDGICLVVGGCATGVPVTENRSGDFLRTITDAEDDVQLFWEAFPAEGGAARTFYMFCYCDTDRRRPSLKGMLDRYFALLPEYTGLPLAQLKFKRVLFAGLPSYHDGPLQPDFDRIIQIGDASASASPLSFGGFGSMLRHLGRLTKGLDAALQQDNLSMASLRLLQPYQPSLSAAWLFQRSMSLKVGQLRARRGRSKTLTGFLPPDHVNRLLACNFGVMRFLGDRVLRPFMQDTIRWWPLTLAMNGMALSDPIAIGRVFAQVGPRVLLNWFKHYWALAAYTLLYTLARPLQRIVKGVTFARILDGWRFGAGLDSQYEPPSMQSAAQPAAA